MTRFLFTLSLLISVQINAQYISTEAESDLAADIASIPLADDNGPKNSPSKHDHPVTNVPPLNSL